MPCLRLVALHMPSCEAGQLEDHPWGVRVSTGTKPTWVGSGGIDASWGNPAVGAQAAEPLRVTARRGSPPGSFGLKALVGISRSGPARSWLVLEPLGTC